MQKLTLRRCAPKGNDTFGNARLFLGPIQDYQHKILSNCSRFISFQALSEPYLYLLSGSNLSYIFKSVPTNVLTAYSDPRILLFQLKDNNFPGCPINYYMRESAIEKRGNPAEGHYCFQCILMKGLGGIYQLLTVWTDLVEACGKVGL